MKPTIAIILLAPLAQAETVQQAALSSAWAIFQEARGESMEGKVAVASVIANRARLKQTTITQTVFKDKAFSVGSSVPLWFMSEAQSKKCLAPADFDAREECLWIAQHIGKKTSKPAGDWTHFYAHKLVTPYWAEGLENVKVIGNHTFGTTKF